MAITAAHSGPVPRACPSARPEAQDLLLDLSAAEEADLRRRLLRWARRCLGLPEVEFADIYQGAWRKLLEGRRNGRSVQNLEHALRWSIHNCWLEECRRRRRRPTVAIDECAPSDLRRQLGVDPAEQVERLHAVRSMFEAARNMDELSWQVVLLRDVWGLPAAEVCETLGVAGRTYRRKHARALTAIGSRLATALGEERGRVDALGPGASSREQDGGHRPNDRNRQQRFAEAAGSYPPTTGQQPYPPPGEGPPEPNTGRRAGVGKHVRRVADPHTPSHRQGDRGCERSQRGADERRRDDAGQHRMRERPMRGERGERNQRQAQQRSRGTDDQAPPLKPAAPVDSTAELGDIRQPGAVEGGNRGSGRLDRREVGGPCGGQGGGDADQLVGHIAHRHEASPTSGRSRGAGRRSR
jgi:RNA polymerase sigma factor (sigma-70 family)